MSGWSSEEKKKSQRVKADDKNEETGRERRD